MWGKRRPALTQASLGGLRRNEEERGCLYLKRRGGEEEQHVRRRAEETEEEEERLSVWKGGRMSERGARSSHTKAGRRRRMKLFGRSTLVGRGAAAAAAAAAGGVGRRGPLPTQKLDERVGEVGAAAGGAEKRWGAAQRGFSGYVM